MLDKYKLIGASYDTLSKLYSGNTIYQCKTAMLREDTLIPGSNVLFAGAGQGQDAIRAAELGANVTVIDISPTMLNKFQQRLESHPRASELNVTQVQGDILKHDTLSRYDVVVANFFLNVFDRKKMQILLSHLVKICRPGGTMIIGDFCPTHGSFLNKSIQNIYWYAAASAFFAIAGNAIHTIYDYRPLLQAEGFTLEEERRFTFLRRELYSAIRATKPVH